MVGGPYSYLAKVIFASRAKFEGVALHAVDGPLVQWFAHSNFNQNI